MMKHPQLGERLATRFGISLCRITRCRWIRIYFHSSNSRMVFYPCLRHTVEQIVGVEVCIFTVNDGLEVDRSTHLLVV